MIVDSYGKKKFVQRNFIPIKNKLLAKNSDAENHFETLLIKSNIYHFREKCNFRSNTRWCYYDFYLPFYRIYVEIDGRSHDNEKQKLIDEEKTKIIRNKQRFLARFTNEEVLSMSSITVEDIIARVALQLKTKKHPRRDYRSQYEKNFRANYEQSISDMRQTSDYEIDENKKVYLYDNFIGDFFEFKNIYEAKMNVQLSINEIFSLLDEHEYTKRPQRRYVFGWTLKECEDNVAKTYY